MCKRVQGALVYHPAALKQQVCVHTTCASHTQASGKRRAHTPTLACMKSSNIVGDLAFVPASSLVGALTSSGIDMRATISSVMFQPARCSYITTGRLVLIVCRAPYSISLSAP